MMPVRISHHRSFTEQWYPLIVITLMFFCMSDARAADNGDSPEVVQTEGENTEWLRQFFDRNLAVLSRRNGKVYIEGVPDGRIARYAPDRHQWQRSFTLAAGDKFFLRDRHGRMKFIVRAIRDDGVLIEARSMFDHRSFGPDKITRDTSVILLPYRERTTAP